MSLILTSPIRSFAATNSELDSLAITRLSNTITLHLGSATAYVKNTWENIDSSNVLVKPVLENNRTLVPVRFIAESLGATVDWNGKTKSVLLTLGSKKVQLVIGSRIINDNGKPISIDVPAKIMNGRTFIPLRAVSETFGKKVFYQNGLIIISNTDNIIKIPSEAQLVDKVDSWFSSPLSTQAASQQSSDNDLTIQQIAAFKKSVVMIEVLDDNNKAVAQGSGFCIGNGLFLTNAHVVSAGTKYQIISDDGTTYAVAGVVKYDKDIDISIIKTTQPVDMAPLTLGNKKMLGLGDHIVTIGSPEGLQNTISDGIVSGFRNTDTKDLIQITAPITHGSSGSPLFNMQGYVVGINSLGMETANLNFAIPIDYTIDWVNELKSMNFSDIQVLDPALIPSGGSSQDTGASGLDFEVTDAVLNPAQPFIYLTNKSLRKIYAYNYETGKTSELNFNLQPEHLTFANNKIYVALQKMEHSSYWWTENQSGAIAVIDASDFKLMEQFDIDLDPYGIAADNSGHIYISSGSGQWTDLKSYSEVTKSMISSASIRQASFIALNPQMNTLYSVDSDSSPRNMNMYSVSDGTFTDTNHRDGIRSAFWGEIAMSPSFKISPDGKFIFNSAGSVFYPSLKDTRNIGPGFDDIAFDLDNNKFYTAHSPNFITIQDYSSFKVIGSVKTNGKVKNLFYRNNTLIAVTTADGRYYIETKKIN